MQINQGIRDITTEVVKVKGLDDILHVTIVQLFDIINGSMHCVFLC